MPHPEAKRARTDSTAKSTSDTVKTPMAAAKESLSNAVELLQPKMAAILCRHGNEMLVCLHKHHLKSTTASKLGDKDNLLCLFLKLMPPYFVLTPNLVLVVSFPQSFISSLS